MKLTALLLSVVCLMGTPCSGAVCPENCINATRYSRQYHRHVSALQHSSVAPWDLKINRKTGRTPDSIEYAECRSCPRSDMIAQPIYFQISVYERVRRLNGSEQLCRCPFDVAVGCTCVMRQ